MSPWFLCLDKARPRSGHSGNFGNKTDLCPASAWVEVGGLTWPGGGKQRFRRENNTAVSH